MIKLSCVFCRTGKFCPMHSHETLFKIQNFSKEEFASTSPPTVFIGSKLKYPKVNVGILAPPEETENAWLYDAQRYWAQNNYVIPQIVRLRSHLINSRFQTNVHEARKSSRFLAIAQEIGMASKPTNIEIALQKKVKINSSFDQITLPMGPVAPLKNIQITENPRIPTKVDKVVSDIDLKAQDALLYLYQNEFNERDLSQLLSLGILGLQKNRRLVPSRFSITTTDDILGKSLIKKIQEYKNIDTNKLCYGSYLGNYYFLLFFPEVFSYELFETYVSNQTWNGKMTMHDYESHYGRKKYVDETAGGYYSARLAVLEHLAKIKRQASVLVLRFITPAYTTPLGVFVCREATRKALQNEISFATKEELIQKTKEMIFEKFRFDITNILKQSRLFTSVNQPKLTQYLS